MWIDKLSTNWYTEETKNVDRKVATWRCSWMTLNSQKQVWSRTIDEGQWDIKKARIQMIADVFCGFERIMSLHVAIEWWE